MVASNVGGGVVKHPDKHSHIAIVGVLGNGEGFLVFTTTARLDTTGKG